MKKTWIALLMALLMLCQLAAAYAGELIGASSSLYFSAGSGLSVADFLATSENRAYATWYGVLEFCDLFGKSYNELDLTQDSFVKSTTLGVLHILLPASDNSGYYDLCWTEKTGLVTLSFDPANSSDLRYDANTFLNDNLSDITAVGDTLTAVYDHELE